MRARNYLFVFNNVSIQIEKEIHEIFTIPPIPNTPTKLLL